MEIQNAIREISPENKRVPMEKKDRIIILKNLVTPTTIVECGFLSNPDDEKKLQQDTYQEQLAKTIKQGIESYFKISS